MHHLHPNVTIPVLILGIYDSIYTQSGLRFSCTVKLNCYLDLPKRKRLLLCCVPIIMPGLIDLPSSSSIVPLATFVNLIWLFWSYVRSALSQSPCPQRLTPTNSEIFFVMSPSSACSAAISDNCHSPQSRRGSTSPTTMGDVLEVDNSGLAFTTSRQ